MQIIVEGCNFSAALRTHSTMQRWVYIQKEAFIIIVQCARTGAHVNCIPLYAARVFSSCNVKQMQYKPSKRGCLPSQSQSGARVRIWRIHQGWPMIRCDFLTYWFPFVHYLPGGAGRMINATRRRMNLDKTFKAQCSAVVHQVIIHCQLPTPFYPLTKGRRNRRCPFKSALSPVKGLIRTIPRHSSY